MKRVLWVSISLALVACVLLPVTGSGAPLGERIDNARRKLERKKRRERVLTTDISGYNNRIARLQGEIRGLQRRQARIQDDLDRQRAELLEVRDKLERARDRLVRLRAELRKSEAALAARLVEIYKNDEPDVLTVVLESDGFADLLERTEYLDRVSDQDQQIVGKVRVLKRRAQRQENELSALETREERATNIILARRNQLAASRNRVVRSREDLQVVRNGRETILTRVRTSRHAIEEDLESLEREQAAVQAKLRKASQQFGGSTSPGPGGQPGPVKRGSGQLIWPVNGPITGSFGEARPGHMHAGVDISAPSGTPIRAADSGRVAFAGVQGGYGNMTCIQHTGSLSTCYAHQSSIGVSGGQSVSQGQVIGSVGSTGNSTGPHLHFEVRVGGSAVNPMGYL